MKYMIFFGSVRDGRLGFRAANFIVNFLKSKNNDVFLYDPLENPAPLLQKAFHHYAKAEDTPKWMQALHKEIISADAYLVVSAEYNHSMPPALTNIMDHFPPSCYMMKPCGIVTYSYGGFAGVRAAMQLRSFLGELGMVTPSYLFAIPKVHEAFSEDGTPLNDYMTKGAETLYRELDWYAEALKVQRAKRTIPSPSY